MIVRIISLLIGYVFGLFQTSFFYGKKQGKDIREFGSGNAGTTNALRVFGTKAGVIVFIGDCIKCILAVLLVMWLFGKSHSDILRLLKIYAGLGAILGHNYPIFMSFRGGKGIACTMGVMLTLEAPIIIAGVIGFLAPVFITRYMSLGSLCLNLVFFFGSVIMGERGMLGMSRMTLYEMYAVIFVIALIAFIRHGENIKRIIAGNERKVFSKKQ